MISQTWGIVTDWVGLMSVSDQQTPAEADAATFQIGSWKVPTFVAGALLGAALTLITQYLVGAVRNYRGYVFLRNQLREEVVDLIKQVSLRQNHLDATVPLYPALSVSAWEALIRSPHRKFMREKRRSALSPLYRAVGRANTKANLIPTALLISQMASSPDVCDIYRQETISLLRGPLADIEKAIPDAMRALKVSSTQSTGGAS